MSQIKEVATTPIISFVAIACVALMALLLGQIFDPDSIIAQPTFPDSATSVERFKN